MNPIIEKNLEDYLNDNNLELQRISSDRNYWFVRTDGGNYFEAFLTGNYVGIRWNDIPFVDQDEYSEATIKDVEAKGYKQPTRVLNQVKRFYKEMKSGDVVVIPSTSSLYFAFGYLTDDSVYIKKDITEDDIENGECPFERRRKVQWVTGIDRARMDPKLYALFRNHQAISNGKDYAEYIERAINVFYEKEGVTHFTLTVEGTNAPGSLDIPTIILGLINRADGVAHELHYDIQDVPSRKICNRINVQSPGVIEFLGPFASVAIVAIIAIALFGGKAKYEATKEKTTGELSTEGLAGLIDRILSHYENMETISNDKMKEAKDNLKIKDVSKRDSH